MRKNWLTVALTAGVLLALLFFVFQMHQMGKARALSQFNENQLLTVQEVARSIERYFRSRSQDLQWLAYIASRQANIKAAIQSNLNRLRVTHIQEVSLLNKTGIVIYSTTAGAKGKKHSRADLFSWAKDPGNKGATRLWYEKVKAPRIPVTVGIPAPPYIRIFLAAPLYREITSGGRQKPGEKFAGVLMFTVDMEKMLAERLPATAQATGISRLWIMEPGGTILLHASNPAMVTRNIRERDKTCNECHSYLDYIETILLKPEGTLEYHIKGGPIKVTAFAPMSFEKTSWIIVMSAPLDQVTTLEREYLKKTLIILGLLTFVLGLIFYFSYRNYRRRVAGEMEVRYLRDQQKLIEEMVIISEIGRFISSTLEIDEVYERMAAEIGKKIPFDNLRINLIDARLETLTIAYSSGMEIPGRRVGESFPVQGTTSGEVIRTGRGVIVQSENLEDLVDKYPRLDVSVRAEIRSIMSVPLISRDKLIGNLTLRTKTRFAYTEDDLHLAEKIGMQIAGAIANAQLFNDLSRTENSLRESEGRFRSLFEQAAVGVAEIETVTGRHCTVNRRLCEMVGRTEEEMLATTFHAITHPDDCHLHEKNTPLLLAGKIRHYSLEKRYIRKDGVIVWVNITVSPLWKPGETPERNMTVVEDITERKKTENQLLQTLESLRAAMNTTVQVMMSAVEARDPYTSGHQVRSADLARAIATEMGLPQEKIDAIRMAGTIHDIGKISIPAEILSKPTKLSELEFSLIKEHARKGYEMLKDVESPWPLAEIVRQHHERMDGSGYPQHLKGDDILIEARILAVADVVEAMASHRPYRPGLGIEAALNEIEKNSGICYDSAVADACLRLFREKGFNLDGINYKR